MPFLTCIFGYMSQHNTGGQLSLFELPTKIGKNSNNDAKVRRLKVLRHYYQTSGKRYGAIRLSGHWLVRAGFGIGDTVEVVITKPGQLAITKVTDAPVN